MIESQIVTLLVFVVAIMGIGDLVFMAWREVRHDKVVDSLTSKIMSRDYANFASYKPEENKTIIKNELSKNGRGEYTDPTLGRHF